MSDALAIAGVTAVIQSLLTGLQSALLAALGVNAEVTSIPPEHVPQGDNDGPRINLFLYRVAHNAAWRNVALPSVDARGRSMIARPPLALDLHYLVTAYGNDALHTEILLGHAMQRLHENPVLARDTIATILGAPSSVPALNALRSTGLSEQLEMIKITPAALGLDELSKLWTALKANYRPSAVYQATVVLIESKAPAVSPLPVLTRHFGVEADLMPPISEIVSIRPASGQVIATLGDTLVVEGHHLDGVAGDCKLVLSNARLRYATKLGAPVAATPTRVVFALNTPADLPAGTYLARLELRKANESNLRTTNALPLSIATSIVPGTLTDPVTPDAAKRFALQPTCTMQLRPEQRISLLLGTHEALADPITAPTKTPRFRFEDVPPGRYWVRLRVDEIDSVLIDRTAATPTFIGPQVTVA